MKRFLAGSTGFVLVIMLVLSACAGSKPGRERVFHYSAPVLLPGTAWVMNTPGFWIGAHPDPDRVIIPDAGIAGFNEAIRNRTGMIQDVTAFPDTVKGSRVVGPARGNLRFVSARKYFREDGLRTGDAFSHEMETLMNLGAVPEEIPVRFGMVTGYTHQRILPTDRELYSSMKSTDIDRLQNSAYDIGTPLAVLHATGDGTWLYTITPLSEGWIKAADIGCCTREQMVHYLSAEPFAVTTEAKVDLFMDQDLRGHHSFARMGCRFPSRDAGVPGVTEVLLPFRSEDGACIFRGGFVMASQVSRGYLPYTPRTIILQAFKLLHSPYGWGDMHGEQDCSRFIQVVFSTVGVQFPRNSLQQAKVGRLIAGFTRQTGFEERLDLLSDPTLGGTSILHMSGHIMLFLGSVDGAPYAIHDMRGYSEPVGKEERFRLVNRVVVSNLYLGQGTTSGAYLQRLLTVRAVEDSAPDRQVASPRGPDA
ncbi:MAG TPA: SH3 domain-containing protein [Deltaproteobacteria bacterium]|nr:SH3 domain-containing protein [Deltaproteobacteria bacterium]